MGVADPGKIHRTEATDWFTLSYVNSASAACKYRIIFVGLIRLKANILVKKCKTILFSFLLIILIAGNSSCKVVHNLFGPKYGCPSDGRNVGAERILSGEKVPKSPKFRG
jgi:hypothetical protein